MLWVKVNAARLSLHDRWRRQFTHRVC